MRNKTLVLPLLLLVGCAGDEPLDDAPAETPRLLVPPVAFPDDEGELRRGPVETPTGERELAYRVVDGQAILQGDIELGPVDQLGRGARSLGTDDFGKRWPGGYVPYALASTLNQRQKNEISAAVADWNARTPYFLYLRTSEPDFIRFVPGTGCSSPVGRQGGQQDIKLGNATAVCGANGAIHEIGHALGLWHEQSRIDRDNFSDIHWDNIQVARRDQWDVVDEREMLGYDTASIMHYPSLNSFAIDTSKPTHSLANGALIPAQNNLSHGDIGGATRLLTLERGQTVYTVRNQNSDKCLDLAQAKREANVVLVQRTCSTSVTQRWYWYQVPWTQKQLIVNAWSGMCVDIPNASLVSGQHLQQFPCHAKANQNWGFEFLPVEFFRMRSLHSNLCMEVKNGSGLDGAVVQQGSCQDVGKQKWKLTAGGHAGL